MNFPAKIFIDPGAQNNISNIFEYRGNKFRIVVPKDSISSPKFSIFLDFISPIQFQYLDFLCKIISPRTIQARVTQNVSEMEKRVHIEYNISYNFLVSNKIIDPDEICLSVVISPGPEIKIKKRIIPKPSQNQYTLDNFLDTVNNYEKVASLIDNPHAGIENQGATCYLNCILQMFFHLPAVCNAVLTTKPNDPISTAIQKLFFRMKFVDKVVTTTELTKAFGWSKKDVYVMRDAEETFVKLIGDMRKWIPQATRLFEGLTRRGRQTDIFMDLHLVVEGIDSLETSLALMIADDTKIERSPPILVCHLRRTAFDSGRNIKIRNSFSYPLIISIGDYQYELNEVIAHSGTANHGHYTAYIKIDNDWYYFNDSRVKITTTGEVLNQKVTAYILTYVRIDLIPEIYQNIDESKIGRPLFSELDKPEDISRFEQCLFLTSEDGLRLNAVNGSPGLLNLKARRHLFCDKLIPMWGIYEMIANLYNLEMGQFRVWSVTPQAYLGRQIPPAVDTGLTGERTLFVERMRAGTIAHDVPPGHIVVLVHVFLPYEAAPLQYVGSFEVSEGSKAADMVEDVCCSLGVQVQPLRAFIVGATIAAPIKMDDSFNSQGFRSGELICFEGVQPLKNIQMDLLHPGSSAITQINLGEPSLSIIDYLSDISNRIVLTVSNSKYSYGGGVSLEDCAREIVNANDDEDVIIIEGNHRVNSFEVGTRHEVSIIKIPKGCIAPLVDVSDDAVTVRESRRIPLQSKTTAEELIECAIGLGIVRDGSIQRLLKIDDGKVTHIYNLSEKIGDCERLRIEAIPVPQLDVHVRALFGVSRILPRRDGRFDEGGPPFLVEYGGGRADGLRYAIAKAVGTADGLSIFRLEGGRAERLSPDSLVSITDHIGISYGC